MHGVFVSFLAGICVQGMPPIVESLLSDNRTRFTNQEFVTLLDFHRIHHDHTPVDSPNHNDVVERQIAGVLEAAMVPCLEVPRLFGGVTSPPTGLLRTEARVYASDVVDMSTRMSEKPGIVSLFQEM